MSKLSDWDVTSCRECYYRRTHESGAAYCGLYYDSKMPINGCEWGVNIQKMGGQKE